VTSTGRWRKPFLATLSQTGNVTVSAEAAGIDRQTAYNTREKDKEFAKLWEGAIHEAGDRLEIAARKPARHIRCPLRAAVHRGRRSAATAGVKQDARQRAQDRFWRVFTAQLPGFYRTSIVRYRASSP
jgi:hypothetical protein